MATLSPTAALETLERALRQCYTVAFAARYGLGWLANVATADRLKDWQGKWETEEKRRAKRGVAAVSSDLLDYAEFHQLIEIADKHWGDLAVALGEKKDTLAFLRRFEQLRNTVAHSRPLIPFEEDLLSGIAGEIRNRVTLYMSSQPTTNEYWARIESVTDSFGNVVDGVETLQASNPANRTGLTLHVGDVVTFECRATDPRGRRITWSASFLPNNYAEPQPDPEVEGDAVTLTWVVGPHHVSSQSWIQIRMSSDNTSHRWGEGWDGFAGFIYQILPADS